MTERTPNLLIKLFRLAGFTVLLGAPGCAFIDLTDLRLVTRPAEVDEILTPGTPVSVTFPKPPDRASAESLMSVELFHEPLPGTFRWEDNTLEFHPETPAVPGWRYVLSLEGNLEMEDGTQYPVARTLPFSYAGKKSRPPEILEIDPPPGALITTKTPLTLRFSKPMTTRDLPTHLNLSAPWKFRWRGKTELILSPETRWPPDQPVILNLTPGWKDEEGLTDPRGRTFAYLAQADSVPREVLRATAGEFTPEGLASRPLKTLSGTDLLVLSVSEPLNLDDLIRGSRFSPDLPGQWLPAGSGLYGFRPDEPWPPDTPIHLSVGRDVKDLPGLPLKEEYTLSFRSADPLLQLKKITLSWGAGAESRVVTNDRDRVPIPFGVRDKTLCRILDMTLHFSEPFHPDQMKDLIREIRLSPLFPRTGIGVPEITNFGLSAPGTAVTLIFENLTPSPPGPTTHYYELTLPGGAGGIRSETGLPLGRTRHFLLEALP